MDLYLTANNSKKVLKQLTYDLKKENIDIKNEQEKYKKIVKKYMINIHKKLVTSKKNINIDELNNLTVLKIKNDVIKKEKNKGQVDNLDNLFTPTLNNYTSIDIEESNIYDEVSNISKNRGYSTEQPKIQSRSIKLIYLSQKESIEKILDYINKQELEADTFIKTIKHIYKEGYYMDVSEETKINLYNFIYGVKNKEKINIKKLLEAWIN